MLLKKNSCLATKLLSLKKKFEFYNTLLHNAIVILFRKPYGLPKYLLGPLNRDIGILNIRKFNVNFE